MARGTTCNSGDRRRTTGAALAVLLAMAGTVAEAQTLQIPTGGAVPPGTQTAFVGVLSQNGAHCGSAQAFIAYDSTNTPIPAKPDGSPDCSVPAEVAAAKSVRFTFWPIGCTGTQCRQVRVFIFQESTTASKLAVDNGVLFNCKVTIPAGTPNGSYPLIFTDARTGDAIGTELPTTAVGGAIVVDSGSSPPGHC